MALREMVRIDEDRCDGCGLCIDACAEGAIQLIDGKAKLVSETYCDGLGACLGHCPQDAITVEKVEAAAFDEKAVEKHLSRLQRTQQPTPVTLSAPAPVMHSHGGGCPGSRTMQFDRGQDAPVSSGTQPSQLRQWPIQLHLVSPVAPYFHGADVVLAADCVAYALGDFHSKYLKGKSLAVCCPKLDVEQEIYEDKLVAMIDQAKIDTLQVMIMEVPCCRGLVSLAQRAAARASRKVPLKVTLVGIQGDVLDEQWLRDEPNARSA